MEAKELFAYYSGHTVLFGVTHFEVISVVVRLVDRGRSEVLCVLVKPEHQPTDRTGLEPVHSWKYIPVAWEVVF
jgi:hypothetical protein